MKRVIVIIAVLILCFSSVFAWQNTYNSDSKEYQSLMMLCRLSSTSTVNMVSPVSSEQMLIILSKIDTRKLNDDSMPIYNQLKNKLTNHKMLFSFDDNFRINPILDFSVQYFKQAGFKNDWLIPRKDRKPFLIAGADFDFNQYFFGKFIYDKYDVNNSFDNSNEVYKPYTLNVGKERRPDSVSPHHTYGSVGYKGVNLILGRDHLSLGKSFISNLCLSSNHDFEDFVKISYLNKRLSYDFTVISFDNSFGKDKTEHLNSPLGTLFNSSYSEPRQVVMLHNFSFSPFSWLNFDLYEGALMYGTNIFLDMKKFNPFMIMHNSFDFATGSGNDGNMNNFFGAELTLNFGKGWNVDVQCMVDQVQLQEERFNCELIQDAFGLIFNVSHNTTLFGCLFNWFAEVDYTSPNLYLKDDLIGQEYWNLDLIVGRTCYGSSNGDDVSYLGYKYGPSTLFTSVGATLIGKKCKFDLLAGLRVHGDTGMAIYPGQRDTCITFFGHDKMDLFHAEIFEYSFISSFKGSYEITDYLSFDAALGFNYYWNYHNQKDVNKIDTQFEIGFTLKSCEVF